MAVIYSYPKLSTLQDKDLLLISDVSSKNKPTNRVELGTLRTYINSFIGVGVIGSGTVNTVPMWIGNQELGDSPLVINGVTGFVESSVNFSVDGQLSSSGVASLVTGEYLFEIGGAEFSAELDMQGNKITDCGDPTVGKDAANKAYVDSFVPVNLADNFVDDAAAAVGGVLVGGLYHTAGVVKIRVS